MILFSILFWAAVFAFVPTVLFLLVKNPPIYSAQAMLSRDIYVLQEEELLALRVRRRSFGIALIHLACVMIISLKVIISVFSGNPAQIAPFDIFPAVLMVVFWISVFCYVPVIVYIFRRIPLSYRGEGLCLSRLFAGYGAVLLLFSFSPIARWGSVHIDGSFLKEIFSVLMMIIGIGVATGFLFLSGYFFVAKSEERQNFLKIHPNVIFVIYFLCVLTFAVVFLFCWLAGFQ